MGSCRVVHSSVGFWVRGGERVRRCSAPLPWHLCVLRLGVVPRPVAEAGAPTCWMWALAAPFVVGPHRWGRLPVLAGVPPAGLCGLAVGLALAHHAVDPDRLLRDAVTGEETQPGLESRRPFATSGGDLLSANLPGGTGARWVAGVWSVGGGRPPAGYMSVSPRRPGAVRDRAFWGRPTSDSVGCALGLGVSVLVRGDGGCPESSLRLRSRWAGGNHIITECPYTIHQMVAMAWLMFMQM